MFRHRYVWPVVTGVTAVLVWLRFYDTDIVAGLFVLAVFWSILIPRLIRRRLFQSVVMATGSEEHVSPANRVILELGPDFLRYTDLDTCKEWPWSEVTPLVNSDGRTFIVFDDANVVIIPHHQVDKVKLEAFFQRVLKEQRGS